MAREPSAALFPSDQPLPSELLIGRQDDVDEIAATLIGGGHLIVAGPRRTGKTSVCDAALDVAAAQNCYVVSVDLFRIASAAELAEALVAATIANRSALRRTLYQARQAGRLVADAAGMSAIVKSKVDLGEELEIAFTPKLAGRDPDRYLDYALGLPGRIAEADDRRVVVFFDEFQEIAGPRTPYGDPDALTKRMRAVFQRAKGVSVLFAGSVEHLMRDLFTPRQRALSQFGSFHELRPITAEAWTQGLTARFEADRCKVDPAALSRLVELGSGHPRATMLIAQKTHLTAVLLETRKIDLALVDQGYRTAIEGERVNHEQTLERLRRAHRLGLEVARRIARGQAPYHELAHDAVRHALDELRRAGIAKSHGRGNWEITDPLLSRYLADLDPLA